MTIERFEDGSGITEEHLLSRDRQYREQRAIEDFFHQRFGIRETERIRMVIDSRKNISLKYEKIRGPVKPRRKLGFIELTVGDITLKSEQVMHLGGDKGVQFEPYLSYDDPELARPLKNSREAVNAANQLIQSVFPPIDPQQ